MSVLISSLWPLVTLFLTFYSAVISAVVPDEQVRHCVHCFLSSVLPLPLPKRFVGQVWLTDIFLWVGRCGLAFIRVQVLKKNPNPRTTTRQYGIICCSDTYRKYRNITVLSVKCQKGMKNTGYKPLSDFFQH